MNKQWLIYSIFILFNVFVAELQAQNCTFSIKGRVLDADDQQAIAYANIYIKELSRGVSSDEKGNFQIENLCTGTYTFECSHIGCKHLVQQIIVEQNITQDFSLQHEDIGLEHIVISANKTEEKRVQQSSTISGEALEANKGKGFAETLRSLPGVNILNTGTSISKPIINGLHSNRIVIYNAGVKMEGQQWGMEHAPEIDPFIADKITVVRGAAGVRYGADAIGGVILVEPRSLDYSKKWHSELNFQGLSNGKQGVTSGIFEMKPFEKIPLAFRLQGTLKKGGNARTPDYFLANTGLSEQNFSYNIGYKGKKWQSQAFYSLFNSTIGIFRGAHIGNLSDLLAAFQSETPMVQADFTYSIQRPQQQILHETFKIDNAYSFENGGKIELKVSRQYNLRREYDAHKPSGVELDDLSKADMQFEMTTHNVNFNYEHQNWKNLIGNIGVEGVRQYNTVDRGGLLPNFTSYNASIYWIERWKKYPNPLELEAGLRSDYRSMDVLSRKQYANIAPQKDTSLMFHNYSFVLGAIYKPFPHFQIKYNIASAWRPPNVNELYSYGVHHGTASFEKGNPDLSSEKALNNALVFNWDNHQNFKAEWSFYSNFINGFIYTKPESQPVLTIRGAFPSFQFAQTKANLNGMDANFLYLLKRGLFLDAKVSILRAKNLENKQWLSLMPADRLGLGLRYEFKDKFIFSKSSIQFNLNHTFEQTRVSEDLDFLPAPNAYTLCDLAANTTLLFQKTPIELGFSVSNLFNVRYRDYLNRFRYFSDELGRNFLFRIKIPFSTKSKS